MTLSACLFQLNNLSSNFIPILSIKSQTIYYPNKLKITKIYPILMFSSISKSVKK